MLLNRFEKALMNNPVRAALQRHYEAPKLLGLGGPMGGGRALEVGCGRGVGTDIVLTQFGADHVDAFDLDADMVARARQRLERHGSKVNLWVGDAARIEADDATYDAVFDFGAIHHIPNWRDAVAEAYRVLRPGGRFYAEEVSERVIHHPVWARLLAHPMEDRFDLDGFAAVLEATGFDAVRTCDLAGRFGFFVADKPR